MGAGTTSTVAAAPPRNSHSASAAAAHCPSDPPRPRGSPASADPASEPYEEARPKSRGSSALCHRRDTKLLLSFLAARSASPAKPRPLALSADRRPPLGAAGAAGTGATAAGPDPSLSEAVGEGLSGPVVSWWLTTARIRFCAPPPSGPAGRRFRVSALGASGFAGGVHRKNQGAQGSLDSFSALINITAAPCGSQALGRNQTPETHSHF